MIDIELFDDINKNLPRVNKAIVNGLAAQQMKNAEHYIHEITKCLAEGFPEGLKYDGYERCSPREQYLEIIRPGKPTYINATQKFHMFECSKSDVYLVKFFFSFNGERLKRPLYHFIPYVSDGGLIHLRGTLYKISPVMSGKVFNIENGSIYMPVSRIRMPFSQSAASIVINDKIAHSYFVYAYLYNKERSKNLYPTILHYILTKYGLEKTLNQFFNLNAIIGEEELDKYSKKEGFLVYRSRQIPAKVVRNVEFKLNKLRIVIPESKRNNTTDSILATLFYITDNCTDHEITIEDMNDGELWMFLLTKFIFRLGTSDIKQMRLIKKHLNNIELSIDALAKRTLSANEIYVNDVYELFKYFIINFNDLIIHDDVGSMYGKELQTTKYVLYNIVEKLTLMLYSLQELPPHLVTIEKITDIFTKEQRREQIFKATRHGELTPESIATDCKPFAITCGMIPYSKASVVTKRKDQHRDLPADKALSLHASQTEIASYLLVTKRDPYSREEINPFIKLDNRGGFIKNPKFDPIIRKLNLMLNKRRRIDE